jgi:WD40 repeat protein
LKGRLLLATRIVLAGAILASLVLAYMTWRMVSLNSVAKRRLAGRLISDGKLHLHANALSPAQLLFLHAYREVSEEQRGPGDRLRLDLDWPRLPSPTRMLSTPGVDVTQLSDDGRFVMVQMRSGDQRNAGELRLHVRHDAAKDHDADRGITITQAQFAAWQPRGQRFVTRRETGGSQATELQVWDAERIWQSQKAEATSPPLTTPVNAQFIDFSADGKCLAAAAGKTVHAWTAGDVALAAVGDRENAVQWHDHVLDHPQRITAICISPGSVRRAPDAIPLIFSSSPGNAWLSRADGQPLMPANEGTSSASYQALALPHSVAVRAAAFSPDGRCVAAACSDARLRIWVTSPAGMRDPLELSPDAPNVSRVLFSWDGRLLAAASDDGNAYVWDLESDTYCYLPHGARIFDIAFSPDGMFLATAGRDRSAQVWRPSFGSKWLPRPGDRLGSPIFHIGSVVRVRFLPDCRTLFTATDSSGAGDGYAAMWALPPDELFPDVRHIPGHLAAQGIQQFGSSLRLATILSPSTSGARVDFSSLNLGIVTSESSPGEILGTTNRMARVTSLKLGDPEQESNELEDADVNYVALSRTGRHVITVDSLRQVQIRDLATGRSPASWTESRVVRLAACDSLRQTAVTITESAKGSTIRFWDWGSSVRPAQGPRRPFEQVELTGETANFVKFSYGGGLVVVATTSLTNSRRCLAHVYRIHQGEQGDESAWHVKQLGEVKHEQTISYADFDRSLTRLVTCSLHDEAIITTIGDGMASQGHILRHTADVNFAVFAPGPHGDEYVITCSDDNTARVWNASNGVPVTDELLHGGYVRHAAVSGDRRILVTASLDATASFWEIETGRFVGQLPHSAPVHHVSFTPGGDQLITISSPNPILGTLPSAGGAPERVSPDARATVRFWNLTSRPPLGDYDEGDELRKYVELLAARRIVTDQDSLSRLELIGIRDRWRALGGDLARSAQPGATSLQDGAYWNERGEPFAAAWHYRQAAASGGHEMRSKASEAESFADARTDTTMQGIAERLERAARDRHAAELALKRSQLEPSPPPPPTENVEQLQKQVQELQQLNDIFQQQVLNRDKELYETKVKGGVYP